MAKQNKTKIISSRVCEEVKNFYDNYRGLTSQVLEDFYFQYKEMQEKKIEKPLDSDKDNK